MNKTVVVGMSGGVDSSVAAYLLKKQGYNVIGATMEIWQPGQVECDGSCCGISAVNDAKAVASSLGIPHYVLNFRNEFKKSVIDYFVESYIKGETPNPCIACNRYVKWESMLSKALEIGAECIATGHYAKVVKHPVTDRYTLKTANTATKDQTYALYSLTQFQLSHTLMPVGEYDKPEIRKIAEEIGLKVANKPDSQDICFVPDGDYASYITQNSGYIPEEGNFVDTKGNVLGRHKGLIRYTIGQRKGLGIALGVPAYVLELRAQTNEVVLGSDEKLFRSEIFVKDFNYMAYETIDPDMVLYGKLRYSQNASRCKLEKRGEGVLAVFEEPQRAPTAGQAAVFYDEGGYCVGGGVITYDVL